MKRFARIMVFVFFFLSLPAALWAQEPASDDAQLKNELYKKYKKEAQAYDKKKFDELFFEFFRKQNDRSVTLTKEEFYSYTIKIAAYSEKLGLLYKDQKETAQKTKQEWFDRSYSDYLNSKK